MNRTLFALAAALLGGCTTSVAPIPPSTSSAAEISKTTSAASGEEPLTDVDSAEPLCDMVCQGARIVSPPLGATEFTDRATDNANRVFASMHADLLACYRSRLRLDPDAHAFLTVDIVIGEDGGVRSVETTGGAHLGDKGLACMTRRIKKAQFDPPHGGGTLHIQVPFAFQRLSPDTI